MPWRASGRLASKVGPNKQALESEMPMPREQLLEAKTPRLSGSLRHLAPSRQIHGKAAVDSISWDRVTDLEGLLYSEGALP